uniref:FRIGIDA-like protein n=1 Tax=Rhizophora mucronata TaxID=61149 RepID=A0A2P2LW17_RHIMU
MLRNLCSGHVASWVQLNPPPKHLPAYSSKSTRVLSMSLPRHQFLTRSFYLSRHRLCHLSSLPLSLSLSRALKQHTKISRVSFFSFVVLSDTGLVNRSKSSPNMGSIPDPGELTELTQPSFDEFQRQTSLMTSCTLLWKELSDHFTSLEQNIRRKSEVLRQKIQALDHETKASLDSFKKREVTIDGSVEIAVDRVEECKSEALKYLECPDGENPDGQVDDDDGMLLSLKGFCLKMEAGEFWKFVITKKKELEALRSQIPLALTECVDPPKFVLEAISEVFPVDKRGERTEKGNDLGWACVLILESLIPVMVDPVIGKSRLLVTPSVKERAKEIAETWKKSLEERGGIENVKTPDVHTFLQHLVTFGIVKREDVELYRKLVVGSAWRKQMPKLALSLGLGQKMPDMIAELIGRGQQLDAVHFTYEVGLVDMFPPVPLLKAFLKDARKSAASILEDPDNTGRSAVLLIYSSKFLFTYC